jgi:hypothetical protein
VVKRKSDFGRPLTLKAATRHQPRPLTLGPSNPAATLPQTSATPLLPPRPNRVRLKRGPLHKTHIELLKRFELRFVLDVTEYERNL